MKKPCKSLLTILLVISLLMSNFAMLVTYAAIDPYPVELAFNNIFVFEKWANHKISTTVMPHGGNGTLETDIENGSFRLTKTNMAVTEIFTAFSMDTVNASGNSSYYNMPVEPNTKYTFFYHVTGNIWAFTPYVFFYTSEGLYHSLAAYPTPKYEDNTFEFTTPENVTSIQIRFTIGDTSETRPDMNSVYADVKDIAICKSEILPQPENLFDFDSWATNELTVTPWVGGSTGTIAPDTAKDSVTITSDPIASGSLFTGLGIDTATSNLAYYTIDVNPSTPYYLSYNLDTGTLPGAVHLQPWIVELDAEGKCITFYNYETPNSGINKWNITTQATTEFVQLVFTVFNNAEAVSRSCTISDIIFYYQANYNDNTNKDKPFSVLTGHAPRQSFDYGYGDTYGTLPVPTNVPDGMVFAGWYTGENGDGTRINPDTPVHYGSLTVYPKFEPKVDSLSVTTMPAKTTYTLGERFNSTGLVLTATMGESAFNILSGYYCTPTYLTSTGTQTITAHYGGKTATFTVTVKAANDTSIPVNGTVTSVKIANNKYTLNYETSAFNRYELTYFSDSYVKGTIKYGNNDTEEFFLEPSDNGKFTSLIDGYLDKVFSGELTPSNEIVVKEVTTTTKTKIESISFEILNNEFGSFELFSVNTSLKNVDTSATTEFFNNSEYKVGIDILNGGAVSELYALNSGIVARVYNENGKNVTKVDYANKLPGGYISESKEVNLINIRDTGRYLQQSYYGTHEKPYDQGYYNNADWNYNPVQGGNVASEPSKVIDYEIGENYIYVKARPLDWAKWSDDFADIIESKPAVRNLFKQSNPNEVTDSYVKRYGEDYITDTYVEATYVFEDGMMKVYNRMVDYSGLPTAQTTQELPAFYTIEPLNHYVYNNVSADEAWNKDNLWYDTNPEFWGITDQKYFDAHYGGERPVTNRDTQEHWAAFMASDDADSFGIGLYSPEATNFFYGIYPPIYSGADRHASTLNPAVEVNTSYIAPVGIRTFQSYTPTEYSYYITTGTVENIHNDFQVVGDKEAAAEFAKTKVAVPETVYLDPANNTNGQKYVNNILDADHFYNVKTVAENNDKMYFGVHFDNDKADSFSIKLTNVSDSSNTVTLSGYNGQTISLDDTGSFIKDEVYNINLKSALKHNTTAVVKWEITFYNDGAKVGTNTAYTVLYAPERTVGAVAESRRYSDVNNEVSSWITGINGIDHSTRSPLGSFHADVHDSGYFKKDPLAYPNASDIPSGNSEDSHDYIETTDKSYIRDGNTHISDDYSENAYVLQGANDGEDNSRTQSYLGLLTVDSSRYTNTNQIPNLNIGFDALRVGSTKKNSLKDFDTWYTLGTVNSFTATDDYNSTPSGWTNYSSHDDIAGSKTLPYRESLVPSFSVSDINGKYIHAYVQGRCYSNLFSKYANAGTSVLCSVTDKGALREAVLTGQTITQGDYTLESYNNFIIAFEYAATILGTPAATQATIDSAKKSLNEAIDALEIIYSLKYDNHFSAHEFAQKPASMEINLDHASIVNEGASIIVNSNGTASADVYCGWFNGTRALDEYFTVSLAGNTEYVFEYDITSDAGYQMHLFFFDANGNAVDISNGTIQYGSAAPAAGIYINGFFVSSEDGKTTDKHVVMKFRTPANVSFTSFRFGNKNSTTNKSIFSNIRLIEASKYYEDVDYSKTESVHDINAEYGTLQTLTRPGYTFNGWKYADGTDASESHTATAHKTIYSQWTENKYTIVYNANGGSGLSTGGTTVSYTDVVTLKNGGFTKSGYILVGWANSASATAPDYQLGQTVSRLASENNATVTLYAVWKEISVVDDAVVVDFGLPVKIQALSNDTVPANATISGVASSVNNDTVLNNKAYSSSQLTGNTTTTYGKISVTGSYIVYTPTTTAMDKEDTFYYECKSGNNYYYAMVTVIPATNIYYEESFMSFTDGAVETIGDTTYNEWTSTGEAITDTIFQAADKPGASARAYGYDDAYANSYTYSLGTAQVTTVNQNSVGDKIPYANFTFYGTGFNLYCVTSKDTGMVQVAIYKAGTSTIVKNFIVDTYYGYTGEGDSLAPTEEQTDNSLYQIPVINRNDLDYGKYDVVIKPIYSRAFDPNYDTASGTGDYSIYIDSVRIFNPAYNPKAGSYTSAVVYNAHAADGELAPTYTEIRDMVLSKDATYDSFGTSGVIFLDGNATTENYLATYKAQGPKNELYLSKNQAIAFNVSETDLAKLQIGMKVVSGKDAKISVNSAAQNITVNSATEMFFDITSYVGGTITITNVSDAVVSLTSLKQAFNSLSNTEPASFMVYEDTPMMAAFAMRASINAADPFNPENIDMFWNESSVTAGDDATLKITTLPEIESIVIDGVEITEFTTDENGYRVWTYSFTTAQAGEYAFDVTLNDICGNTSDTFFTDSITVENAPETDSPEDDSTQTDETENGNNALSNIFSRIIEFIKKIINFIRGLFA